jgi:hypothetical protein
MMWPPWGPAWPCRGQFEPIGELAETIGRLPCRGLSVLSEKEKYCPRLMDAPELFP